MPDLRLAGAFCLALLLSACGGSPADTPTKATPAHNTAPVANAGPAQEVKLGAVVTLDGSASSDADGDSLSYTWVLSARPSGSVAMLTGPTTVHPSFMADMLGSYTASLIVNDGKTNSANTATVAINVTSLPIDPTMLAMAGRAQTVAAATPAVLGDPVWLQTNPTALSYSWTLAAKPAGSTATLSSATSAQPSLTPDLAGNYTATLVASDGQRLSPPVSTTITAMAPTTFNSFVAAVSAKNCADISNLLYLVDGNYVFNHVEGNCADANFGDTLYGLTPDQILCSGGETIAGPRSSCTDASLSAMFDTMSSHPYASDLGLGSGHQVSKFVLPPASAPGATAVAFSIIDHGYTNHSVPATAIVTNDADWAALWQAHKGGNGQPIPLQPPVDFTKKIVLGLFYPQITSCQSTSITSVYYLADKLIVEYTLSLQASDVACAQYATFEGEIISIDKPADPNQAIVFQKKTVQE